MFDPNVKDFYERVGRLKVAHAQGNGFEATGVLGRSHYRKPQSRSHIKLLLPVVFFIAAAFCVKGTIHYFVGGQAYDARIEMMQKGEGFDKLGAALMAPDRVTLWISDAIRQNVKRPS